MLGSGGVSGRRGRSRDRDVTVEALVQVVRRRKTPGLAIARNVASVLPRFSNPWIALALKAVVGLVGAAAQGRGTDCQYAKGYLRRFPEEAGSRKPRRFGAAGGAI